MPEEFRVFRNSQYEVSSYGRVFATNYQRSGQRKELSYIDDDDGYYQVSLRIDGKPHRVSVHSMVCECFLGDRNGRVINHKDEDKHNNHIDNLEYCTVAYNNCYGSRLKRVSDSLRNHTKLSKVCSQYTISGELIRTFPSEKEAKRETGIKNITKCCNGVYSQSGGYVWRFGKEKHVDVVIDNKRKNNSLSKQVAQYTKSGELVRIFPSVNEVNRVLLIPTPNVCECCNGKRKSAGGFIWKYV